MTSPERVELTEEEAAALLKAARAEFPDPDAVDTDEQSP